VNRIINNSMKLNVDKFLRFLQNKNFYVSRLYSMENDLMFAEVVSQTTGDEILLYIPSKYIIPARDNVNNIPMHALKEIEIEKNDHLAVEYAGQADDHAIELAYGDVDVDLVSNDDHIEDHLTNKYKKTIDIRHLSKSEVLQVKSIYRQLQRLAFGVKNLKYKLAILYKKFLFVVRRDDSITCFEIKKLDGKEKNKTIRVVIDLETFFEKEELNMINDVRTVRDSIYKVLEKNQSTHTNMIQRIMENKKDIFLLPQLCQQKKVKYDALIERLESMYETIKDSETNLINDFEDKKEMNEVIRANKNDSQTNAVNGDIERVNREAGFQKEKEKLNTLKAAVIKYLTIIRNKKEFFILGIDKVMFDNTIMFDAMMKNFGKLKDFS
jgi:hypothetical protein